MKKHTINIGIGDQVHVAHGSVHGDVITFQLDNPVPDGPYAGQETIRLPLSQFESLSDAAAEVVNVTMDARRQNAKDK